MATFNRNDKITIYGVTFDGVDDIIEHCRNHEPKDGVLVGEDSQLYPCFDSSDYLYENRRYWNFVFAKSEKELKENLQAVINSESLKSNYNKLGIVAPMAYWGGDSYYPVEVLL